MFGLNVNEVKLFPYNQNWKKYYEEEEQLLNELIGENFISIEHFGSTAIEGMKAKPIIDIMVGVPSLDDVNRLTLRLNKALYFPLKKQTVEQKVIFAKFPRIKEHDFLKTHYLHFVEYDGDWWNKHLKFRDRLRQDQATAKEYEFLKDDLAKKYPNDPIKFGQGKESFVDQVLSTS